MARVGWIVLLINELLSLLLSFLLITVPFTVMTLPEFQVGKAHVILRGWGFTWLALSIVVLVILLTSFRRNERWAWYTLWVLPLLWLSHFFLAMDTIHNLVFAIISAVALLMTYRQFFASS